MTHAEFKEQMKRVTETFGAATYPQTRLDAIWQHARDLSAWRFKNIVTQFIITSRYPPLPVDFIGAIKVERIKDDDAKAAAYDYGAEPVRDWSTVPNESKLEEYKRKFREALSRVKGL